MVKSELWKSKLWLAVCVATAVFLVSRPSRAPAQDGSGKSAQEQLSDLRAKVAKLQTALDQSQSANGAMECCKRGMGTTPMKHKEGTGPMSSGMGGSGSGAEMGGGMGTGNSAPQPPAQPPANPSSGMGGHM